MQWFRLHAKILHDPRVQTMSAEHFRLYINLLCYAAERDEDGTVGNVSETAFVLRETETSVSSAFHELSKRGLIETDGETFHIPQWRKKQYKSDTSTVRVRKFREKRNGPGNVSETAPDTDSDTEQISKKEARVARAQAAPSENVSRETSGAEERNIPPTPEHSPDVSAILDAWSAMAVDVGWADGYLAPTCSPGDLRQIAHLAARYGPQAWPDAMANIRGSPFYRGEEGHWSGASLSWVLREENFVKVLRNDHGQREKRASNGADKPSRYMDFLREGGVCEEDGGGAGREPDTGLKLIEGRR